ncbi:PTS sugar transporter subunit IIC [Alkaliphilus crotonatoxidans]
MKKLLEFLEKYFVPVAGKIGAQRHLVAIRDGFVAIMPLIIAGSLAVLINNLPVNAFQNALNAIFGSDVWKGLGNNVSNGSLAVMALLVNFSISYSLAKGYNSDPLAAGVVSVASLMAIMQSAEGVSAVPYSWLGALGLFVSIIVAIISTEIFVRLLGNPKLVLKMPEGVPPAVAKSFAALFPAMITILVFAFIKIISTAVGIVDIHATIYDLIQRPLSSMANTLGAASAIAILNHLLWFFGLHGPNILEPVMQTMYLPALQANIAAFASGQVVPNIVTKPFFDAFVYMGGSGTTICLIIAIYIASKRKHHRYLANMAAPTGLFNINEPIIFGLPIVLNPVFLIPFILTPLVLTIFSYLTIAAGIIPKTIAMVPWTTPPIISGILATGSWRGGVLSLVNIVIGVILYMPFIIMSEKLEDKKTAQKSSN